MSVKKEASGRRWVTAEVEVPGTPEEVWQAIATGPGVSSWFVPTEEREDGTIVSHFGPGMDAVATKTAWEPPHRFAGEADLGPNGPRVATEWIVEARSGGTCVVRVVHSLFASSDDWDDQLGELESGWPAFFHILRLYMVHFRGQDCAAFRVISMSQKPVSEAWKELTGALGFAGAGVGERRATLSGAPPLAGVVERLGEGQHPHQILLRLEEPAPGIAFVFAHDMCGMALLVVSLYVYGDGAAAAAADAEPAWQAWMNGHFAAGVCLRVKMWRSGQILE